MAVLYEPSLVRATDDDGNPINGAKMNVYLSGTTTNAIYYLDADEGSAGPHPLVSDATGTFNDGLGVFIDPTLSYRIKVTNATGSDVLYDADPVSATDSSSSGTVAVFGTRAEAIAADIPTLVQAVFLSGYSFAGDRGAAMYRKAISEPTHAAWFQSADGAYWALSENTLNPFMFGASGNNNTDDSAKIQAMFDYIQDRALAYPVDFMGAKYRVSSAINLPIIGDLDEYYPVLIIRGGGARIRTTANINIFQRIPADQTQASDWISRCTYEISGFSFLGTQTFANQTGIFLSAVYNARVSDCNFLALGYGLNLTFGLDCLVQNCKAVGCITRAFVMQAGTGFDNGAVWGGSTEENSPCNVSVFDCCSVYGRAGNLSNFGIFSSDGVHLRNCVSEGLGTGFDLHYDYAASTTSRQFKITNLHCESVNASCNLRIRAGGVVTIEGMRRSFDQPILDPHGSSSVTIIFREFSGFQDITVGTWFYQTDGNGVPGPPSSNQSSGSYFIFEDGSSDDITTTMALAANWEGNQLPLNLKVVGNELANGGSLDYSINRRFTTPGNAGTSFDEKIVVAATVAAPAGGSSAAKLVFGTVSGFGIYYGSGAPTVSAGQGSMYMRTDGSGTTDRMYINTNGSSTWTAVTTVA